MYASVAAFTSHFLPYMPYMPPKTFGPSSWENVEGWEEGGSDLSQYHGKIGPQVYKFYTVPVNYGDTFQIDRHQTVKFDVLLRACGSQ